MRKSLVSLALGLALVLGGPASGTGLVAGSGSSGSSGGTSTPDNDHWCC